MKGYAPGPQGRMERYQFGWQWPASWVLVCRLMNLVQAAGLGIVSGHNARQSALPPNESERAPVLSVHDAKSKNTISSIADYAGISAICRAPMKQASARPIPHLAGRKCTPLPLRDVKLTPAGIGQV